MVTRHLLLNWSISSSNAIVVERSDIGEITTLIRNKLAVVVAAEVVAAVVV